MKSSNSVVDSLSERQRECLLLVAQGFTSKEIGRQIGISPATVDNHIRAALEILNVGSRQEAARMLLAATSQPLTSQSRPLATTIVVADEGAVAAVAGQPARRHIIPPVGGSKNEQSWTENAISIIKVAAIGLGSLAVLSLTASTILWVFS